MISDYLNRILPSTEELPYSDDTPVDNVGVSPSRSEDQNFLPNVLLFLLSSIWAERFDWYFGADMAIYHTTGQNVRIPVVPDGFLSLGVERQKGGKSRRSYAVWEENQIVPILTLEMVHTPGHEYDEKMEIYAKLGVLYYLVYNPEFWQRDKHQPFEIYKLDVEGDYQLQIGEPYWMPEVGLGIGRYRGILNGIDRELLAWFDRTNTRYLMPEESAQLERQIARTERQRADRLAAQLRALGIDPDL
jgi:Uma2 family endonuclease